MRLFAARGRYRPNRSVITFFLFVNRHSHKGHPLAVWRNLRITDPDKIKKIFLGDVALLREGEACAQRKANNEARMPNDPPTSDYGVAGEEKIWDKKSFWFFWGGDPLCSHPFLDG